MNLTSSSTSLHSGTCTHIFLSRMLCTSLNSGQSLRTPPILSSDSIYYRILSPDRVHSRSLNCQSSFSQSLRHSNRSIFGRRDTSQFLWIRGKQICRAVRGDGDAEIEGITKKKPAVERSESANEELLLFFFQLDLTTRLQRALNQDAYEIAQQLRERIAEVEQEVARQREAKMGSVSSKDEAQDKAITLLQLKAELQKLIEDEDYAGAGVLKNQISSLEGESLAAQVKAMVYRQLNFQFRLGQKVKHKLYGYRGVICGMDPLCCETSKWTETAGVDELPRGRNQPFYQVLVDVREEPSLMVTYVAEDNLLAPEVPDIEQFDHPYVYFLFYGMDGAGDFIACKQLRDKYNAPRRELPYEEEGDDSNPETGGPD